MPPDGNGLNPLLQNIYMVIHPPSLYIGLVGMTIPFAFGMAALITGHLDDAWLRAVRRWTMFAWIFLSFGLTLGMIWAYEELGWGGFWGWDPVENAGLAAVVHGDGVPSFRDGAGAAQHAARLERHAGDPDVLPDDLRHVHDAVRHRAVGALVRREPRARHDVLRSSWSCSWSSVSAWSFTGCRCCDRATSSTRGRRVKRRFIVNNWILLFCAFFVLFATMFPTLSEAMTGERITVGPPFFNRWMLPIGLVLLLLTGIGPLLAWRKSTMSNLDISFSGRSSAARHRRLVAGAGRPRLVVGHLLRVRRLRARHDQAGVLARRGDPAQEHRHRSVHRDDRPRGPLAAPLRRLHRSRRHRADVPGICRAGIQAVPSRCC